jgi:uncharacterized repeat protein (TIGR03803 family)
MTVVLKTLVTFNLSNGTYPDGAAPYASLIADANGDLFGTTQGGGPYGYGTVFEIVNSASGYASSPSTLISFNGGDGQTPQGSLMADANGDLFGTTENGGTYGYGTVYEIINNTASGYQSTPTTLASFTDNQLGGGGVPTSSLIADDNGDLFGTTFDFGPPGTVFEIARTASGYASSPTTLVAFDGNGSSPGNGACPYAGLIADANGDLFGTTTGNLTNGYGTVFEIAKTASGYASSPTTLVSFNVSNGASPYGSLRDTQALTTPEI